MLIYDEVKPIRPEYHVVTDDATYCVEANRYEIAQDDGIVIFKNKYSVQAMFRLEDVKEFWRVA